MIKGLHKLLTAAGQPGAHALRPALQDLFGGPQATGQLFELIQLPSTTSQVYRLRLELNGQARSVVIKRLNPGLAWRNRLVCNWWLPAVGLGDHGQVLLASAAEPSGDWVWQVYEDWGDCSLRRQSENMVSVQAAVKVIAQIHLRFAEHPWLFECRLHGADLGANFFAANMRDAIRNLEHLQRNGIKLSAEQAGLIKRLLTRLYELRQQQAERVQMFQELGGPETLLHGDLWTKNIFVLSSKGAPQVRLIDWDRVGVGPISYDLSTFLLRFPRARRWEVLNFYRQAVADQWRLPPADRLNELFETAEFARFATHVSWPAIALMRGRTEYAFEALGDVEQWFEQYEPVLPQEDAKSVGQLVTR